MSTPLSSLVEQRARAIDGAALAAHRDDLEVAEACLDHAVRLGEVIAEREAAVLAALEVDLGRQP